MYEKLNTKTGLYGELAHVTGANSSLCLQSYWSGKYFCSVFVTTACVLSNDQKTMKNPKAILQPHRKSSKQSKWQGNMEANLTTPSETPSDVQLPDETKAIFTAC